MSRKYGFPANLEIGEYLEKVILFSSEGKIMEFEKNASNQKKIREFVWPKSDQSVRDSFANITFTQPHGEERMVLS